MPRQNFISKEFFVNASESEIKQTVLTIPQFVGNIKFLCENTIGAAVKFIYETPGYDLHNYVYVSLLPLNDQQTRVSLHVTYTNGQVFGKDSYISNALTNFESAIYAGLQGNLPHYRLSAPKVKPSQRLTQNMQMVLASVKILLLWKKFS
jgi:hypothetical protein